MRVFYTATDNGDGSLGVQFFESAACINVLEETDFETYRGEGGGSFDCYEFSEAIGTMEDVKDHLRNFLGMDEDQVEEAINLWGQE